MIELAQKIAEDFKAASTGMKELIAFGTGIVLLVIIGIVGSYL